MKIGIYKKILRPLKTKMDLFRFWYTKYIWGFHNAILLFRTLHKQSIIPVLKLNGAAIGDNCDIETGHSFHNCQTFKNLIIGNNCHIGKNCFFDLRDRVEIGNNVVISMDVRFITHIDMSKSSLREYYPSSHLPVKIGNDVYIGTGSTILMGVNIGRRAFVAAGAIVTHDVESNTMVGGVPAKFIKKISKIE
jgi:acetyltransferase-like isoleucine patch superfamily enzyme